MNRNLKLALAALLGFSAACTSVKNAPKERRTRLERERPESLPPVAERPQEEDPSAGGK